MTADRSRGRRFPSRRLGALITRIPDAHEDLPMEALSQRILRPQDPPEDAQPAVRLAARDLSRRYGVGDTAVDALRGVSVTVAEGELTAVMGPSGSGKSTLMHLLAGLDRPTAGEVWIDGTAIAALGDGELTQLRREHI